MLPMKKWQLVVHILVPKQNIVLKQVVRKAKHKRVEYRSQQVATGVGFELKVRFDEHKSYTAPDQLDRLH
jgi:hypothetical protein